MRAAEDVQLLAHGRRQLGRLSTAGRADAEHADLGRADATRPRAALSRSRSSPSSGAPSSRFQFDCSMRSLVPVVVRRWVSLVHFVVELRSNRPVTHGSANDREGTRMSTCKLAPRRGREGVGGAWRNRDHVRVMAEVPRTTACNCHRRSSKSRHMLGKSVDFAVRAPSPARVQR